MDSFEKFAGRWTGVASHAPRWASPLLRHRRRPGAQVVGAVAVAALLLACTAVTWLAGGTGYLVPHHYYLPVIAAGFLWSWPGGVLVGAIAGLMTGPWMPMDVAAGEPQSLANWMSRLGFFVGVGGLNSLVLMHLRNRGDAFDRLGRESLLAFTKAVDAKSPYTARHSQNVARLAVQIGQQMHLPERTLGRLFWAGLLHDIGKLKIPDAVLNKPTALSEEEWVLIREHPLESVRILDGIGHFRDYLPAIRHHHERIDGKGYPDGVTGEEMSLEARILAVADAFEAMTSSRPYRRGMEVDEALRRLDEAVGTQFDAQAVAALQRVHEAGEIQLQATVTHRDREAMEMALAG